MENITNTPVQEPENTVETKKKKIKINLDKPERFMIFAVLVANGAVPVLTSLIGAIAGFIYPSITKIDYTLANVFTYLTGSIESLLSAALSVAAVVVFAYLAYKSNKIKNAALFIGVFFVAESVLQVIIDKPVGAVLSIIFNTLTSISYDMFYEMGDWDIYRAVSAVSGFLNSSLQFIIDTVCLILTAVLAVAALRIVNGKLKIKFKKKKKDEAEETQPEVPEEFQENA